MPDGPTLAILLAAAFLPAVILLVYLRNQERSNREPWPAIFRAFLFGAVLSVLIALFLETVFHTNGREYQLLQGRLNVPGLVMLVVVIAPLAEEFAKGLGVRGARRHILEEEDGIIYGAAAGFGFAATENLFYELAALNANGQSAFLATAVVRAITGNFLHATASGILGYGIGRKYRLNKSVASLLPYYLAAVALHAAFNLIAVLALSAAVFVTLVFALLAFRYTVRRIRRLDSVPAFQPFQPPEGPP